MSQTTNAMVAGLVAVLRQPDEHELSLGQASALLDVTPAQLTKQLAHYGLQLRKEGRLTVGLLHRLFKDVDSTLVRAAWHAIGDEVRASRR